ncbi:RNA polymerase subunit sigma-70 [Saccharobesus litoralis]|uniref:RNA polymerase subunit sigma-70 n=2 Tax=Saccharobesus litoralis TaxID=2172099 RepID=A0A2S0VXW2_9ALTE|nr:RNA polymerase subunit sigma-70 [Saccharobesus litoralis]
MEHQNKQIYQVYLSARDNLTQLVSIIVPSKEVEDIVQETYVKVCQQVDSNDLHNPRSFMMKTAKNLALDYLKRAETRLVSGYDESFETGVEEIFNPSHDTCTQAQNNQELATFCQAVSLLPTQTRKAFVLKRVFGYSQKEIAQELNIAEKTVEKHISNGFKKCGQYMRERGFI